MYKLELGRGGLHQPDYFQNYQLDLRLQQETGDQVKSRSKDIEGTQRVEKVAS